MKTEKYILSVLCLGVGLWTVTMSFGVAELAYAQGPVMWWALWEVAAFGGAGLLPLWLVWKSTGTRGSVLIGLWMVCMAYVTLLALNGLRLGLFEKAGVRLALWSTISVLFVRELRRPVARSSEAEDVG